MTTPPDPDLRTTLHRLADSTTPLPVDDGLWQRGQATRRRSQAFGVAAVLALVVSVGGIATVLTTTDREARTATGEVVEGGAIPSRIEDIPTDLEVTTGLAVGRASVAYISGGSGAAIVIGATTGAYHRLPLPDAPEDGGPLALSPDGRTLAWANHRRIHAVDLQSGDESFYPNTDEPVAEVTDLQWVPNSQQLLWSGTDEQGAYIGGVLPVAGRDGGPLSPKALRGIPSPNGELVAVTSDEAVPAARFLQRRAGPIDRVLPSDLYPDGAAVTPVGWATDSLLVAQVDGPPGSYVEGRHLALLTSPDRPESEWTYRIVMREVPEVAELSLAVDLIPDLNGTSSQQFTHDFGDVLAPPQRDISWMIGLGVAVAVAVLMGLRRVWRRFF